MSEQHRHLANKCEDTVNLQGAEAYCVATRTVCHILFSAGAAAVERDYVEKFRDFPDSRLHVNEIVDPP